jgi:membrane-associated phospholipid phosphatase
VAEWLALAVESLWRVTIAAAGVAAATLAMATSAQIKSRGVPYVCFVELIVPPVDAAHDVRRNITGALPAWVAGKIPPLLRQQSFCGCI